jgi:hypothetical protein
MSRAVEPHISGLAGGLTLNFALFYREVLGRDQDARHLSKFGFDEAAGLISIFPEYEVSESTSSALSIFKGHLIPRMTSLGFFQYFIPSSFRSDPSIIVDSTFGLTRRCSTFAVRPRY